MYFFNQRNSYIHNLVLGKGVTLKDAKSGNKNKNNFKEIKYKQPLPLAQYAVSALSQNAEAADIWELLTISHSKDRMISEESECKFSYISKFLFFF